MSAAEQAGALAVLDDLIADMGTTPGTTGAQLAQARDDLRELIEANFELAAANADPAHTLGRDLRVVNAEKRLQAALARVEPQS